MWVLDDKQNGSAQGSFPKRMHGRVFFETDARNPNVHFDGCVERTFGQRICARYGANPGCAQPTSRMHATPLTAREREREEEREKESAREREVESERERERERERARERARKRARERESERERKNTRERERDRLSVRASALKT